MITTTLITLTEKYEQVTWVGKNCCATSTGGSSAISPFCGNMIDKDMSLTGICIANIEQ